MTTLVESGTERPSRPAPVPRRMNPALRVAAAVGLGLLVQLLIGVTVSVIFAGHPERAAGRVWLTPTLTHAAMLVFSLGAILLLSRGHAQRYGLCGPAALKPGVFLFPAALSVVVSAVSRLFQLPGIPFVEQYSIGQQILLIWGFASIAEEALTRGLIQGFLEPLSNRGLTIGRLRLSVPVLTGALFFGAMHLLLFTTGLPASTVLLIVAFAVLLGIIAGIYRERSGSLVPAIFAHASANAAGALADWLLAAL